MAYFHDAAIDPEVAKESPAFHAWQRRDYELVREGLEGEQR
jgi:hypothetical protein